MKDFSVMLVEDNSDDEELALRTLRKAGFSRVLVARDGYEALAILHGSDITEETITPDLVFLDLKLPRINGIEVLRKIRYSLSTKDMKVVVLSSSDDPRDMIACEELGVIAIFPKPLTPSILDEILSFGIPCKSDCNFDPGLAL